MTIIRIDKTQAELVFDLFDKYRVFYEQQSDIETAKEFIRSRLDNNESVIFAALDTDAETAVGFTQLYPSYSSVRAAQNWILNDLFVAENYRKQGIGEKLINKAMDFAAQDGSQFIELSTAVDNHTAQSLYEQIGFSKQEPEAGFYTYRIALG